jgi:hypothetical protein
MDKIVTIGVSAMTSAANRHGVGWTVVRPDGTVKVRNQVAGGSVEDDVEVRTTSEGTLELRPRTLLGRLFVSLLIAGG